MIIYYNKRCINSLYWKTIGQISLANSPANGRKSALHGWDHIWHSGPLQIYVVDHQIKIKTYSPPTGNQNIRMGEAICQANCNRSTHGIKDFGEERVLTWRLHDIHAVHHANGAILHDAVDSTAVWGWQYHSFPCICRIGLFQYLIADYVTDVRT